jgi:hypothetical protein
LKRKRAAQRGSRSWHAALKVQAGGEHREQM